MDKRRVYNVTREAAGNRLWLLHKTKKDGYDSTVLSYEEFENIKGISDDQIILSACFIGNNFAMLYALSNGRISWKYSILLVIMCWCINVNMGTEEVMTDST